MVVKIVEPCSRSILLRGTKIAKIKQISVEKAQRKGILNAPKDGVLFVTTKKGYYFDLSCE